MREGGEGAQEVAPDLGVRDDGCDDRRNGGENASLRAVSSNRLLSGSWNAA